MCIICRKQKHNTDRHSGKRSYEHLVQCELIDGGQLLEAARLKEDHAILCHIENRDCVAIELKYHTSCHREYTRFLCRAECTGEEPGKLYSLSFDKFCELVIVNRIITGKEVLRLTKLKKIFDKTVMDTEGNDSSCDKTWNFN